MKYDVLYDGAFAMLKVLLEPGESVKAEMGAMVAMSPNVGAGHRGRRNYARPGPHAERGEILLPGADRHARAE